jgi:hypothetical protein
MLHRWQLHKVCVHKPADSKSSRPREHEFSAAFCRTITQTSEEDKTMKALRFMLCLLLCGGLIACSSVTVKSDFDASVNFAQYKTFDFMSRSREANPLHNKRVEAAIEQELAAKGVQKQTAGKPDLLVAYHTNVRDKIDVNTYGYRYGRYGRRVGTYTTVEKYQQGTLVVDLVDATAKELVWRGWAKGEVNDSVSKEKIDDTVGKILDKYPPQ